MNEFDQFVKHELKVKQYARYTDDFVIITDNQAYLESLKVSIQEFLARHLALYLHPDKVSIQPCHRGVDFLGYIVFPHHQLVRTKTRQRIFRKLKYRAEESAQGSRSRESVNQSLQSYLGVLAHANARKLSRDLKNHYWFWLAE